MHEEQRPPNKNDLSKLLLAMTGLQQSLKDEPAVVAPWHLKLALKHCASVAANHSVKNEVEDMLKKLIALFIIPWTHKSMATITKST